MKVHTTVKIGGDFQSGNYVRRVKSPCFLDSLNPTSVVALQKDPTKQSKEQTIEKLRNFKSEVTFNIYAICTNL